jgi:flagellar biosynthetic protein FlhB
VSEDADESSKTEDASSKKLEEAHSQGRFPLSREVNNWIALACMLLILAQILPRTLHDMTLHLTYYIEHADEFPMDRASIGFILMRVMDNIFSALWLPVLLLMMGGVLAVIAQKGWSLSWELISPKFSKLNPLAGLKRIFSPGTQGIELLKSVAKIAIVGSFAYVTLMPVLASVDLYPGIEVMAMAAEMKKYAVKLLTGVLSIMAVVTAADVFWTRYDYARQMRMTKQEVKDEYRQSEGDPHVKGRIRQLRMVKSRQRMMASVPKADVVVTNPTHYAVALKYDPAEMGAPMVVAKGIDQVALNIRRVAEDADVPIIQNPPLARALYAAVEIDQEVPSDHYRAVAELITYVFKLKGRTVGG